MAKEKDSTDTIRAEKADSKDHTPGERQAAERDTGHHFVPAATTAGYMDIAKTTVLRLAKDSKEIARDADYMVIQLHSAPKVEARKGDQPTWQMGIHHLE